MNTRSPMGLVAYALSHHQRHQWDGRHAGLPGPLAFLEECAAYGAGAIQIPFTLDDAPHAPDVRRRAESLGMAVEAILSPPRDEADLDRFEREIVVAQSAGASLARTVIIPGRRYERFRSMSDFREFEARGRRSLERAEPILARHRFRLAVENHKDQRIEERVALMRHLDSPFVGICVDLGNSFALLEDPLETVRAYAPWAMTVHIKDQALRETPDGFQYADVALGDGFLDLGAMVASLRHLHPAIRFHLETITRDALVVPVLLDEYWATLRETPARDLARVWDIVRRRAHPRPFPEVSKMTSGQQLALERDHIERSFAHAIGRLGL